MPSTLTSTGITFNDGTSQNTAAGGGVTKSRTEMYTAAATHTISSNADFLEIHAVGGGGAGGEGNGGGGGGGGYAYAIIEKSVSIPNVNSLSVNIGAGGNRVLGTNTRNNGGASSVGGYVVANGGNKGNSNGNGGTGGTGGSGTVNFSSPLDSATGSGGNGGGGNWNQTSSGIRGNPPTNYGGGGGGKNGQGGQPGQASKGSDAMGKLPFYAGSRTPGHRIEGVYGNNAINYNITNQTGGHSPEVGQGGTDWSSSGLGGDGIVVITESGS